MIILVKILLVLFFLYLFEIEKIFYNFNGTYLNEKYIQMSKTIYSYVSIIGDIFLAKLKNSMALSIKITDNYSNITQNDINITHI
jgi:hypothetical protein